MAIVNCQSTQLSTQLSRRETTQQNIEEALVSCSGEERPMSEIRDCINLLASATDALFRE